MNDPEKTQPLLALSEREETLEVVEGWLQDVNDSVLFDLLTISSTGRRATLEEIWQELLTRNSELWGIERSQSQRR